jgi:hypothetical protein
MIVIRIFGGLGNQMFQYAAAKALALKQDTTIKVDLRWMRAYRNSKYLLGEFPLNAEEPDILECLKYTWFPFKRRPFYIYIKFIANLNRKIYMEPAFQYNCDIENIGSDKFLFGYFQSENYFEQDPAEIRKDFAYKPDLSLYDATVINAVRKTGSTAIQFRRGDYITDQDTNRNIGFCGMDYYDRAIAYVKSNVPDFKPIIFSDDIAWCKENVRLKGAVFVERSGGSPLDDMHLAAQCHNIIMANSTFSWWCAWLNSNPDKIVIAPKRWFRSQDLHEQSGDLVPSVWVRL